MPKLGMYPTLRLSYGPVSFDTIDNLFEKCLPTMTVSEANNG